MKKAILYGASAMLFLGVFVAYSGPAQAEPPNHPGKCGEFTGDPFACRGHIICTNDGDFMCCTKNDQGGESCDKVESLTSQGGKLRLPGGQLQTAPGNSSTGTGTVRQPVFPGTKAPIMRRGIEGEQPAEPTPATPTSPEQPSGTKPQ
jgi:hypothetical protein